jgi:16S rRNA processing protein RimM
MSREAPCAPSDLVVMGQVGAPFGVRGWFRVHTFTERADGLLDYATWWLGNAGAWREYRVQHGEVHDKGLAAKLEGIDDRDAVGGLRGRQIAVPRHAMPEAEPDAYYWADLTGLRVINLEGEVLGTVDSLFETGAHDVMRVLDGKVERLIPFVAAFIKDVALKAGEIRVDWGSDF